SVARRRRHRGRCVPDRDRAPASTGLGGRLSAYTRRVETISFARGVPAPECIPVDELADCARVAVGQGGAAVRSYGPGGGFARLRAWIGERYGVEHERVVLTNGSLQGFVFLAERLAAGKRVLVEAPTYDRPLRILARLGAEVVALPMDEEGLDPDALEQALRAGPPPAFLYTIPTFQNPSGRTLSLERRRQVLDVARRHGLLVVEDDPYGLVSFDTEPPPTLHELAGGEGVVHSSSFSKTIAPGVRVGWFGGRDLADDVDAADLLERATAAGVTFVKGADFFPGGEGGTSSARLAYSFVSPAEIEEGVERLAAAVPARVPV